MATTTWRSKARCAADPDLFFTEAGSRRAAGFTNPELQAKRQCALCPVRRECLLEALSLETQTVVLQVYAPGGSFESSQDEIKPMVTGIWGGMTQRERYQTTGDLAGRARELDELFGKQVRSFGLLRRKESAA